MAGVARQRSGEVMPFLFTLTAGIWLTAAPQVVGYRDPAQSAHHILGPLIATIACISWSEAVRPLRWVNVGLAVVLAALALIPPFAAPAATLVALPTAAAIAALSALAPPGRARFGGGWRAVLGREQQR